MNFYRNSRKILNTIVNDNNLLAAYP